ncbi:tRNA (cytosine(34)-C(5))-methyltransferase, mitochondrial [Genypterus blacodes]|uniref:tRNA (cytosine(34)-C(5))-methyltransferase, mitochondrial n=1 Tax=Genypterus blacodes TaxID=154954 RepID=UPI003F767564
MYKSCISAIRSLTKKRITSHKAENVTLSPVWRMCRCNSHTGPDFDFNLTEQKGLNTKGIKSHKKARPQCKAVLDYFDQQYNQELGQLWTSARAVLLDPDCWQYGVMLNRFTALTDIKHVLQSHGFSSFLPQTDTSTLLCNDPTPASNERSETSSLLPSHHIPGFPPNSGDSHVHLDSDSSSPRPPLQCYIHPYPLRFPSQAHRPGQLKQYYLLNAASLLPVLALQVKDGENVLDLCAAPGGKALAIMQTATPASLCCNEPDPRRRDWLAKTLESFLPHSLTHRVIVSGRDGRCFGQSEAAAYDKVLVDAPCSNDKSWLYSSDVQQGEHRLKQRAKLPVLQAQLLKSALSAVRPGGAVVYSTCTLSSAENLAVVEMVLRDCPDAELEDLREEFVVPFSQHFTFSPARPDRGAAGRSHCGAVTCEAPDLGILVVPQPGKTWGPMFLSRIRRRK